MPMKAIAHAFLVATAVATAAFDKDAIGDGTPSAALAADDECLSADGGCALSALQHKSANVLAKGSEEGVPVTMKNNASNSVLLANCQVSMILKPGGEIRGQMLGGFWVIPEDEVFNCSAGCADCFFVSTFTDADNAQKVRIGYGVDSADEADDQPLGGGIVVKAGSETVECWNGACGDDWTKSMTVDTTGGSAVEVTVQGAAAEAAEESEESGLDASWRGRVVVRGPRYVHVGRVYRRPALYHPRRVYRRRAVARGVACAVCSPYTACWYLCYPYR